jgi:hypothetical protein
VDPGWKKFGSGNRDLGLGKKKFGSRIRDPCGKSSDLGSGIQDKHPGSATLEILLPNLLGLNKPNNNQTLWGKGILE